MSASKNSDHRLHVDNSAYLRQVLTGNPLELIRILKVIIATAKYRFLFRCIGVGTVVGLDTKIVNSANVRIGEDCLLQDTVYIRAGTQGVITIGDRVAINSFAKLFGHGGIEIGEETQIGPGSLITTTDHDPYNNLEPRFKKVTIGRRVWVGANVTILPGVMIGDYAVIGAGSVVTRDIPGRCLAIGVPAKVAKQYGAVAKHPIVRIIR